MLRRSFAVAMAALVVATPAATAHEGDPNYLSTINRVTPELDGVTVEVLNRDDRLVLRNRSGEDVIVRGYEDEPYAEIRADGTVLVNLDSRAHYLNEERFGGAEPPADADSKGEPRWDELDRSGRFEWHDHRMHWMSEEPPEQVRDVTERRKIYDWSVPLEVGGRQGAIAGTLFWTPQDAGGPPTAAIVVGAGLLALTVAGVVAVRRRRSRAAGAEAAEAW